MKEITLEGGIKVRTFRPPPQGFDPLTASRADLERFGFPPRPDDPHHLARYRKVWGRLKNKFRYIEPTFRVDKEKIWGPRRRAEGFGTEQSLNWSGGVVYAPSGKVFKWLQGDWVVPDVDAPTQGGWYYCGTWIGIDGDGSDDVFQAGIGFDVSRQGDITVRDIYPWWEWAPAPPVNITNFPIGPGDMVTALLYATGSKPYTVGTVTFTNRTGLRRPST